MTERGRDAVIISFPAERMRRLQPALITKKQLAARWGVSTRWIEERQRRDGLPFQKEAASRLVRYDVVQCERWRDARLGTDRPR